MAALPYMQLYVAEYLADTSHLNAAQHGAYLLLLMNYWQRGKALKNNNERLANVARMSSAEWEANREVLSEFFDVTPEEWIHKRVERDLESVLSKSKKASAAGKASAERRFNNRSTDVEQTFNHTDTDTEKIKERDAQGASPAAAPQPPLALGEAEQTKLPSLAEQAREVYAAYPLKKGKGQAILAVQKAIKKVTARGEPDPVGFFKARIAAWEANRARKAAAGEFVPEMPFPQKWFNRGDWDEEDLAPRKLPEFVEVSPEEYWRDFDGAR